MEPQNNQNPLPQPSEKKSFGPLIGIILIVLVFVIGAFYFWGEKILSTHEANTTSGVDFSGLGN